MSFKEKQEFEQIEKDLPLLEKEKELLSAALSTGNLTNEELMQRGERLGTVVAEIDDKTLRWLELSEIA
jgi:ATP-binding cassette subfamily F protein uup